MKIPSLLILVLIIIVGGFFRLWQLADIPNGLYWDELDVGYQAYSLLETGKDYFGNPWPIFIHSFGDFRTPLFIYSTIPFVANLGLSSWSVRLPAAIWGILTIPMFYLMVYQFSRSRGLGLLAAGILAISPWHIQFSRMSFEVSLMLLLYITGLYGFWRGLHNWRWLIVAVSCFSLTIWTYSTAKLMLLLIGGILGLLYFKQFRKLSKFQLLGLLSLGLIIILPSFYANFYLGGNQRFSEIAVFTDPVTRDRVNNDLQQTSYALGQTGVGSQTFIFDRIFINRFTNWGKIIIDNYLSAFSSQFLFIEGDPNLRHSPPGTGQFYPVEAILIILGIYYWWKDNKLNKQTKIWLFGSLILAPLPAMITREGGTHATRLIWLLIPVLILSASGIFQLWQLFKERWKIIPLAGLVIISLYSVGNFYQLYFRSYPVTSSYAFNYGFIEAVEWAVTHEADYKQIIFDGYNESFLMAFLFNQKYSPNQFQSLPKSQIEIYPGIRAWQVDKYYFLASGERNWHELYKDESMPGQTLTIITADQLKAHTVAQVESAFSSPNNIVHTISYPDQTVAVFVIEHQICDLNATNTACRATMK